MTYTLPNFSAGFSEVPAYLNYVTDGLFGMVMLLVVFVVSFFASMTYTYKVKESLFASMFIVSLSSALFFVMGLIGETVLIACVIGGGAALVFNVVGD